MLKWARESCAFSIQHVAKAEKIDADTIAGWEKGVGTPSFATLRKLATRYKRPLMVFYLEEPPRGFQLVKDFRTLPAGADRDWPPELIFAIRDIQERQRWASTILEEEGVRCPFIGSETAKSDPAAVAKKIRRLLPVTLEMQSACPEQQVFKMWRNACESAGVFVLQSPRVSVEDMRGCALSDKFAPIIVVNSADSELAKVFTLLHEFVHLLIGVTAISGAGKNSFKHNPDQAVERFCNEVAAATLVPSSDLREQVPEDWDNQDDDDWLLESLSRRYRVSRAVVAYRLVALKFAGQDYLRNRLYLFRSPPKAAKSASAIPQHTIALSRVGGGFAKLAIGAYRAGIIHGGELSRLLHLNLKHLPKLEGAIYPERAG